MKTLKVIIIGLLSTGSISYGQKTAVSQPVSSEAVAVQNIGSDATTLLLSELQSALIQAMQAGGPVNAISVCRDTAQQLTHQIGNTLGQGVTVKRTSKKFRNPANAPDEMEQSVLERYALVVEQGEEIPPFILQKYQDEGEWKYRYYKPLKVTSLCLNCHGNETQIDPAVQAELNRAYPDDHATGYKSGDFRGVVSVTMTEEFVQSNVNAKQ